MSPELVVFDNDGEPIVRARLNENINHSYVTLEKAQELGKSLVLWLGKDIEVGDIKYYESDISEGFSKESEVEMSEL